MSNSALVGEGAPISAPYITQTASGGLSAEQATGTLTTGLLKNTTGTGVLTSAVSGVDYYGVNLSIIWEKIQTITIGEEAFVDFVQWNPMFTQLKFVVEGYYGDDDQSNLMIRFSTDGGDNFSDENYVWCNQALTSSSAGLTVSSSASSAWEDSAFLSLGATESTYTVSGIGYIFFSTSSPDDRAFLLSFINGQFGIFSNGFLESWTYLSSNTNGLRFFATNGDMTAGKITFYGAKGI